MTDCFELAGISGLSPEPRTLRELFWAAHARQRTEWERLSCWISSYAAAHGKKIDPRSINPFIEQPKGISDVNAPTEIAPGVFTGTMSQMKAKLKGLLHERK